MEFLPDREVAKRLSWPLGRIKRLLFYRQQNGLSGAVIKLNKSVLIDFPKFLEWLEDHRETPVAQPTQQPSKTGRPT